MTEEEVVNVRCGEISDSVDADQHKIKAEYCNDVAHESSDEVVEENGTVGAAINGESDDIVAAGNGGNSGASDLNKVEGVAVGESDVELSGSTEEAECECEAVKNENENENDCEEKTEISNLMMSVGGDVQNDEGSVVVSDVSEDVKRDVTDSSENHDREFEVQNGAANETRDSVVVDGVKAAEANGIHIQNGEIHGDEIENGASGDMKEDIVLEKKYGADTNGNYSELVCVAVENCMVNKESEVSDVKECAEEDGLGNSAEKVQIASVDSGGGDEKDGKNAVTGTMESVSDAVSDEEVGSAVLDVKLMDHNSENVANGHVQNGSECGKKDEIPVVVDGTATDVDVKECMGEDVKISSDEEKEKVETVSDFDSDKTEIGAEIPVEGEHKNDLSSVEVSEVESRIELLPRGEDSFATNVLGDRNVVSDVNDIAGESEDEPSKVAVESGVEPSRVGVESEVVGSEVEPSPVNSEAENLTVATVSEAENLTVATVSEAEPSTVSIESEAELLTVAVESEAEPSTVAVESEAEPSSVAVESEAEPSSVAVENEAGPSAESKISVECEGSSSRHEEMRPTQERSSTDALDRQNMGSESEVVRRPFYYLIRFPRYDDDENIKEQIKVAFNQVEEKTRIRDAIRAENQAKKGICKEYHQEFRAALTAERASRDLLKSKRQEMDSVQFTMNRLNNEISVGDIDDKIRNMEHMIQHETLPLKEEKQLIRQIKQLKQSRDELSCSMRMQDQSKHTPDHKDSIEESFKQLQLLKKEMELLRNSVQKAEATTKAARKKYDDECRKQNEISAQFRAADEVRQEAYVKLQTLKKQLHEKSKYFWEYRDGLKKGQELAAEGKKEELQRFCIDQVEKIMEMWNKNDEVRWDYVRCNTRSTLRRLQTLDGRSLGPDEEPPVVPNAITERASTNNSVFLQSIPEQEKKSTATESPSMKDEPVSKAADQKTEKSQTTKAKKPDKPASLDKPVATISQWGDEPEDTPEEPVRTKEEEEQILMAEKARKEEEAARLKEKRRLEEIEKAKEAIERKKRNAEKAQQRAVLKAQKEAEQKEKEREKRLRKKERRKAATTTETAENTEQKSAPPLSETVLRSTEECDQSEKQVMQPKKMQKPSQFTKQSKAKSIPLPLRNRGKRQIQPWMWVLLAVLAIVGLFFMGNSSSVRSWLQGSGY